MLSTFSIWKQRCKESLVVVPTFTIGLYISHYLFSQTEELSSSALVWLQTKPKFDEKGCVIFVKIRVLCEERSIFANNAWFLYSRKHAISLLTQQQ